MAIDVNKLVNNQLFKMKIKMMKNRILVLLCLLISIWSCSKENIDETKEVSLHIPTIVSDKGAAVSFKVDKNNTETIVENSYCTSHGDFYFITPEVPCIEDKGNGAFSITTTGDEEYTINLSKESGEFNLVNSFLLTNDPDLPHISSIWDSGERYACVSVDPILEILEETDDFIAGTLEAEFFESVSDENVDDPLSFCTRTESIGLVTINFVALKTVSDCE